MTRTLVRAGVVAVLSLALFVAGGIGVLRVVGPSGTAPRPAVAAARSIPPVVLTGTVAQEIASLQARVRALPSDWRSLAELGIAYVQQARLTADPSFYPRAEGVLRRSLSLEPADDFEAMTGMASLAAARHDFAGALAWGRRGEALDPYSADVHAITGDALVELGRYHEAFAEFQRAVDLKPNLTTYARASYAQELQGANAIATGTMKMAVESAGNPDDLAWTTSQLGDLSFNEGDLGSAARSYRRAMQVAPDFIAAHAGMANVDTARGHLPAAVAGYEWVVARYPLPQYVIALGDLYSRTGNDALADHEYRLLGVEERLFRANGVDMDLEVAQFDADHHVDLVNGLAAARAEWGRRKSVFVADALGWELYANGRPREALSYANRALGLGTRNALFFFHRGMIERALGRAAPAERDLRRAIQINPYFSPLWADAAARTLHRLEASR